MDTFCSTGELLSVLFVFWAPWEQRLVGPLLLKLGCHGPSKEQAMTNLQSRRGKLLMDAEGGDALGSFMQFQLWEGGWHRGK